jgi:GNAT superfamily N-acetyltransferase
MATREQLAENTGAHILPRPRYPVVVTEDYTYVAGPNDAWVLDIRSPNIEWARAETARRGLPIVEWWVGWSSPPSLADELLAHGLEPSDEPLLSGMTSVKEPPAAAHIDVRAVETVEQLLEGLAVDWEVWQVPEESREQRRARAAADFEEDRSTGVAHHWVAFDDDQPIGFGRALDMDGGVALMGGAVLPEARGRGVYRALVRARWDHAVARGTPLLVVQAGPMSAPVLDGLGFQRHGEIRLFADRL